MKPRSAVVHIMSPLLATAAVLVCGRSASQARAGPADGVAIMTVVTPSGPKRVPGDVTFPKVFGPSVRLEDLHAVVLGKATPKHFKPQALFGEPLLYAALCLVGNAADPSSVPVVATLLADPNRRKREWAAGALGGMGELDAALRAPIKKAVSTMLRPTEGQIPEWLMAAFRQPLLLYQDASGAVHVEGKKHDLDSIRQVLAEHVGKTRDDYVCVATSARTPDAMGNRLNRIIQELRLEPLGRENLALPQTVWTAVETEVSAAELEKKEELGPLPLGAQAIAYYRLGKFGSARLRLVQVTGISYYGVRRRTPSRQASDLEEKLGHVHVVQLVTHCLALERGTSAAELARAAALDTSAILSAASTARETMQSVLDEVEQLEAKASPLVSPRARERAKDATRQLAALVAEEIKALRAAGRAKQAKELENRYRPAEEGARAESPAQAALGVLKRYQTATANLNLGQLRALFLPDDETPAGKNRRRHLEDATMEFAKARHTDGRISLVFEEANQRPVGNGFLIRATVKDIADKQKPPRPVEIRVVPTDDGWKIADVIHLPAAGGPGRTGDVPPAPEAAPMKSAEPLPPGRQVIALYQAGKLPEARRALVDWVRDSAEAAKRTEARGPIDLESRLGHSAAANLVVHCLKLDRQARGKANVPPELLEAAKLARETMQAVIEEVKALDAKGSPMVTDRVTAARKYAERQLAELLINEILALRGAGKHADANRLVDGYGSALAVPLRDAELGIVKGRYAPAEFVTMKVEDITLYEYGAPLKAELILLQAVKNKDPLGTFAVVYRSKETGRTLETRPEPALALTQYPAARMDPKLDEKATREIVLRASRYPPHSKLYKREKESTESRWCFDVADPRSKFPTASRVILDLENRVVEVYELAYE